MNTQITLVSIRLDYITLQNLVILEIRRLNSFQALDFRIHGNRLEIDQKHSNQPFKIEIQLQIGL